MKIHGLDTTLQQCSLDYYTLCTSPERLTAVLDELKVPHHERHAFMGDHHHHGASHFYDDEKGNRVAVVTIFPCKERSGVETIGIVAHEAMHILQRHYRAISEHEVADEEHAYALMFLLQALLTEYGSQIAKKKKGKKK